MSTHYYKELFNNGNVRLSINIAGIKSDVADENIELIFYAIDSEGSPLFSEKLGIREIRDLYNHLDAISVISEDTKKSGKFIETNAEINALTKMLKENDIGVVLEVFDMFESESKIRGLLNSLSELEIENLHGAYHHKLVTNELVNLDNLIKLDSGDIVVEVKKNPLLMQYSAGQPERVFQNWIESNLWIFGVEYIKKHDARKIAIYSEADFLMESADGYLDLIELKRPKHDMLKYDSSHKCYYPHPELSKVIGQSLFYLKKLQDYRLIIEKEYEVKVIMPRIKIIIGNSDGFNQEQKDCLRMLNSSLNFVHIITYNELLEYGRILLGSIVKDSK